MKNLLVIAFMFITVYSSAATKENASKFLNDKIASSVSYNVLGTIYLSQNDIKLPLRISVVSRLKKY